MVFNESLPQVDDYKIQNPFGHSLYPCSQVDRRHWGIGREEKALSLLLQGDNDSEAGLQFNKNKQKRQVQEPQVLTGITSQTS